MNSGCYLVIPFLGCTICCAQNLIPNANFEQYSSCPTSHSQLYLATSWLNPNLATPDYLNQCTSSILADVPANNKGFQYARSGVGYAGIVTYVTPPALANQREYLEVQLTAPLVANSSYHFQMYVTRANSAQFAIESLNVYFSAAAITGLNNYDPLPVTPQLINSGGYLTDTLNWTLVSGNYTAAGGENYLIIGNFLNDANTNVLLADSTANNKYSYYFVDDVSLTLNNPLPVQLVSFTANMNENAHVVCKWTTAAEINNDYFTIQKSVNGFDFEAIGIVKGAGTSNAVLHYSFTDFKPYEGVSYYRIKQTDFNGAYSFSKVLTIDRMDDDEEMQEVSLFPNPSSGIFSILYPDNFLTGVIEIYSVLGDKISAGKITEVSTQEINLSHVSPGIYFVKVFNSEKSYCKKIVVE